jgi:hypothetical protein
MMCLVYEGTGPCVWCRTSRDQHPYRWCRRCNGDIAKPDPTDREAQLAARPTWAWRQQLCACNHGIVTMKGEELTDDDVTILQRARTFTGRPLP